MYYCPISTLATKRQGPLQLLTITQKLCPRCDAEQWLRFLEVCPQGMAIAGNLAGRVAKEGGAALVIDYGRDRPYPASLAAIRDHGFVNMLSAPGLADLSAHVDFSALR